MITKLKIDPEAEDPFGSQLELSPTLLSLPQPQSQPQAQAQLQPRASRIDCPFSPLSLSKLLSYLPWLFSAAALIFSIFLYSAPTSIPTTLDFCNPLVDAHCWGLHTRHNLRGEGPRNRTQIGRENATLLMLVRNEELDDALSSIKQIEDRFNRFYRYPWTFLNDQPFTDEFKNYTSIMASGETQYGQVPQEAWSMPDWIDEAEADKAAERLEKIGVVYGGSRTYRKMCRWFAGWFWRDPIVSGFDWYWRVEPNIGFFCDMLYDPFEHMRKNGKKFSFVIALPEYGETIQSLWDVTKEFAKSHPQHVARNNSLAFIVDDAENGLEAVSFNTCHFWSNFELGSLSFFRSQAYRDYFAHLDRKGGFFYERWGDAPVHSIAAALFLNKDEIHFWQDVGYSHVPWGRCPWDEVSMMYGRCAGGGAGSGCERFAYEKAFDFHPASCLPRWMEMFGRNVLGEPVVEEELGS